MRLSEKFDAALIFAHELHRNQKRKGTQIPYISHLLGVAAIVLEAGGDEDQAIAALLHDAVEDQGGLETLEIIEEKYGPRVAGFVEGMTDTTIFPKPPWRERKEAYLDHLKTSDSDLVLIALADKLHNARSILRDLETDGPATWERFKGGREGSLWYYIYLAEIFSERRNDPFTEDFLRVVQQIEKIG